MLTLAAVLAACDQAPPDKAGLERADYADLPGWASGDQAAALPALRHSCRVLDRRDPAASMAPPSYAGTAAAWQAACAGLAGVAENAAAVRAAVEAHFVPYRVAGEGLFTGYYEPELRGSLERGGAFTVPIHGRPADLVEVALAGYQPHPSVGRFVGRREGRRLQRYPSRDGILSGDAGDLPVIAWVDDPVDAFFLHIQGSGVIELTDGSRLRVGFAAHNGHPYVSIGRKMIERGLIDRDDASAQSMAAWMRANPTEAEALMREYPRYVFFRASDAPDAPVGALGVPLTPGHSLAVDREHIPLGAPLWLDTRDPLGGEPLRRLVAAQDTGGAIKGRVRGDLFWGTGDAALERAGRMKEPGSYYVLLPRGLAPGS